MTYEEIIESYENGDPKPIRAIVESGIRYGMEGKTPPKIFYKLKDYLEDIDDSFSDSLADVIANKAILDISINKLIRGI